MFAQSPEPERFMMKCLTIILMELEVGNGNAVLWKWRILATQEIRFKDQQSPKENQGKCMTKTKESFDFDAMVQRLAVTGCVENEDPKTKTEDRRPCGLKRRPTGLKRRPCGLKRGLKRRPCGLKRRPTGLIAVAHKLKCHLSARQTWQSLYLNRYNTCQIV